jgi:hypothetical protein
MTHLEVPLDLSIDGSRWAIEGECWQMVGFDAGIHRFTLCLPLCSCLLRPARSKLGSPLSPLYQTRGWRKISIQIEISGECRWELELLQPCMSPPSRCSLFCSRTPRRHSQRALCSTRFRPPDEQLPPPRAPSATAVATRQPARCALGSSRALEGRTVSLSDLCLLPAHRWTLVCSPAMPMPPYPWDGSSETPPLQVAARAAAPSRPDLCARPAAPWLVTCGRLLMLGPRVAARHSHLASAREKKAGWNGDGCGSAGVKRVVLVEVGSGWLDLVGLGVECYIYILLISSLI